MLSVRYKSSAIDGGTHAATFQPHDRANHTPPVTVYWICSRVKVRSFSPPLPKKSEDLFGSSGLIRYLCPDSKSNIGKMSLLGSVKSTPWTYFPKRHLGQGDPDTPGRHILPCLRHPSCTADFRSAYYGSNIKLCLI